MSEFVCSKCDSVFSERNKAIDEAIKAVEQYGKDREDAYLSEWNERGSGCVEVTAERDFYTKGLTVLCWIRYGFPGRQDAMASAYTIPFQKILDLIKREKLAEYALRVAERLSNPYYIHGPYALFRMPGDGGGWPQYIPEGGVVPCSSIPDYEIEKLLA